MAILIIFCIVIGIISIAMTLIIFSILIDIKNRLNSLQKKMIQEPEIISAKEGEIILRSLSEDHQNSELLGRIRTEGLIKYISNAYDMPSKYAELLALEHLRRESLK